MSATESSVYEKFDIISSDRERTVDISAAIANFVYYEDIFSPTVTAKVTVMDTGNTRIDGTGDYSQSLFTGLPVVGNETFDFSVRNKRNQRLSFGAEDLICFKPSNINIFNNRQFFTLNLISKSSVINEQSRVLRRLPLQTTDVLVESILNQELGSDKPFTTDSSLTRLSYIGNSRKPFTVIGHLAAKSVGDKPDKSSGFVFFETSEGFNFRSIDNLIAQPPKENYYYTNITQNQYEPRGMDLDQKILRYSIEENADVMRMLRYGGYASKRYIFNPVKGSIEENAVDFNKDSYSDSINTLGKKSLNIGDDLGLSPSRILSAVLDIGALSRSEKTEKNIDPTQHISQSVMRYNILFTQVINIVVPSNFDLHAGDVILCDFPKTGIDGETDQEISGKYLIKELCHYFDSNNTYTALRLVRDTYGRQAT